MSPAPHPRTPQLTSHQQLTEGRFPTCHQPSCCSAPITTGCTTAASSPSPDQPATSWSQTAPADTLIRDRWPARPRNRHPRSRPTPDPAANAPTGGGTNPSNPHHKRRTSHYRATTTTRCTGPGINAADQTLHSGPAELSRDPAYGADGQLFPALWRLIAVSQSGRDWFVCSMQTRTLASSGCVPAGTDGLLNSPWYFDQIVSFVSVSLAQ